MSLNEFQMVQSPNAYTYSNGTGGSVSGNVMTLSLNAHGGAPISVSHSDEPFELWMEGKQLLHRHSLCRHRLSLLAGRHFLFDV